MKFKRIIFNLFYEDGFFCQSRNFFLQRVGDVNWLKNTFGFENLSNYIDELIITLTTTNPSVKKVKKYLNDVEIIKKNFFLPITLAGGIRSIEDVQQRFNSGADKILLNSLVHIDIEKINSISNRYGSQAVILGCDYIYMNNKETDLRFKNKYLKYKHKYLVLKNQLGGLYDIDLNTKKCLNTPRNEYSIYKPLKNAVPAAEDIMNEIESSQENLPVFILK